MCIDSYVSEQFLFLDMSAKYVEVLQIKKENNSTKSTEYWFDQLHGMVSFENLLGIF